MQWKICFSLPIPWNACYPAPNTHVTVNVIVIRHDSFISKAKTVIRYPSSGIQRENVMTIQKRVINNALLKMSCRASKTCCPTQKLFIQCENVFFSIENVLSLIKRKTHYSYTANVLSDCKNLYPERSCVIQRKNVFSKSNAKIVFMNAKLSFSVQETCLKNLMFVQRKSVPPSTDYQKLLIQCKKCYPALITCYIQLKIFT